MFDSNWNPTDNLLDLREQYHSGNTPEMDKAVEYLDLILSVESAFLPRYRHTRQTV